jgi:hypothetical protein
MDKQPNLRKMDMRFGMWNVRILYRAHDSYERNITTEVIFIGNTEIRWDRGGT